MGRKSLGESKIYICDSCFAACKRAVISRDKKPCPKCGKEGTFKSDKVKTKEQFEIPTAKSFKAGEYKFQRIGDKAPKIGDRIVYFSDKSGDMLLTGWTAANEANIAEYQNCLWLGPLVNPCTVA